MVPVHMKERKEWLSPGKNGACTYEGAQGMT